MVQSLQYGDNQPSESDDSSGEPFFVRRWAPEVGLHMLFVHGVWKVFCYKTLIVSKCYILFGFVLVLVNYPLSCITKAIFQDLRC
jgi:hypothetical protein